MKHNISLFLSVLLTIISIIFFFYLILEVIHISCIAENQFSSDYYVRKISDKDITVENFHPLFQDASIREKAISEIKDALFDVFSSYLKDR